MTVCDEEQEYTTYLQVLVCRLLPFLVQCRWYTLSEHADKGEETEADCDTNHRICENLPSLSWRSLSSGTVVTESDEVCCQINHGLVPV